MQKATQKKHVVELTEEAGRSYKLFFALTIFTFLHFHVTCVISIIYNDFVDFKHPIFLHSLILPKEVFFHKYIACVFVELVFIFLYFLIPLKDTSLELCTLP